MRGETLFLNLLQQSGRQIDVEAVFGAFVAIFCLVVVKGTRGANFDGRQGFVGEDSDGQLQARNELFDEAFAIVFDDGFDGGAKLVERADDMAVEAAAFLGGLGDEREGPATDASRRLVRVATVQRGVGRPASAKRALAAGLFIARCMPRARSRCSEGCGVRGWSGPRRPRRMRRGGRRIQR